MKSEPPVEFYAEINHETEKAYLFFDGASKIWLPKGFIIDLDMCADQKTYSVTIPHWLAKDKEII